MSSAVSKAQRAYEKAAIDRAKARDKAEREWRKSTLATIQRGMVESAKYSSAQSYFTFESEGLADQAAGLARELGYSAEVTPGETRASRRGGAPWDTWKAVVSWTVTELPEAKVLTPRKWYQFWK
jgi:hypothetical protein